MMRKLSVIGLLAVGLVILNASATMAGDAFLKGGYKKFRGEHDSEFNTWIVSGGSDYKLIPYLSLGFEVQYSHKKVEEHSFNWLNLYINGKVYGYGGSVRPYIGGGIGLQTATEWTGELEDTTFTKNVGYQLVGGVAIGPPGALGLVLEAQLQLPKDLDGITAIHFMAGITF